MPALRKFYRTILLGLLLVIGIVLTFIFLRNHRPTRGIVNTIIGTWLGSVACTLGVKTRTYGTPLLEKTLFVANHISWLDILVLGKLVPVHFLSKHEIKSIPLLGWLATRAGTLYIKRGCSYSASDAGSEITAALNRQHNTIVFAEGTTTDGHVKKFHSRLMQSAIDAGAMVQPVAIFYPKVNEQTNKTEINPDSLFVGGISAGESFNRIIRARGIDVEVHFLEPIDCTGKKRDEIARHAYNEVVESISLIKNR